MQVKYLLIHRLSDQHDNFRTLSKSKITNRSAEEQWQVKAPANLFIKLLIRISQKLQSSYFTFTKYCFTVEYLLPSRTL